MKRICKLANGLRYGLERRPNERKTTICIGIGRGISDEPNSYSGISHFFEHLAVRVYPLMPKTAGRIDSIGATMDANCGADITFFYCEVPSRSTQWAFHLLADLVLNPDFPERFIESERGVSLEELGGKKDSPSFRLEELNDSLIFAGHPLANPVFGRLSSLRNLDLNRVMRYWRRLLDPASMVITVVGNFDRNLMVKEIRDHFGDLQTPPNPIPLREQRIVKPTRGHCLVRYKDMNQVNYCWTILLPGYRTRSRFPLMLLANIIGGRPSSPLFLKLRENGSIYQLDAEIWFYPEIGYIEINSACSREKLHENLQIIRETLNEYQELGISWDEFELAKASMRAQTHSKFDQTEYAAKFYAGQILAHGHVIDKGDFLRRISMITRACLNKTAGKFLASSNYYFAGIGPLTRRDREKIRELFSC